MAELNARLTRATANKINNASQLLKMAERALSDPDEFIARRGQMLDYATSGLVNALEQWLSARALRLSNAAGRLFPPERQLAEAKGVLSELSLRLVKSTAIDLERRQQAVSNIGRLLDANSFERVLDRGFALVTDRNGGPIKRSAELPEHANALIRFADGQRLATFDRDAAAPISPHPKSKPAPGQDQRQKDLF
jgi:exodeoxyribonuclease VII large subunit